MSAPFHSALLRPLLFLLSATLLAACVPFETLYDDTPQAWYWLGGTSPAEHTGVRHPARYSLTLHKNKADIVADCNRGSGEMFTTTEGRLWIEKLKSTRAMCGADSRSEEFFTAAQDIGRAFPRGEAMRTDQQFHGARLYFARDPAARFATWRCSVDSLAVIVSAEAAHVWVLDEHFRLQPDGKGGYLDLERDIHLRWQGNTLVLRRGEQDLLNGCKRMV